MQKTCQNLFKYFILIHLVLLLFLQSKARETSVYETNQSRVALVELRNVQTTTLSPSISLFVPLWLVPQGVKQSHSSVDDSRKILIVMVLAARYWGCFK